MYGESIGRIDNVSNIVLTFNKASTWISDALPQMSIQWVRYGDTNAW